MHNRVRQLRADRGLTQNHLAKRIGISRARLIAIEKHSEGTSLETALKISRVLRQPIESLFSLAPRPEWAAVDEEHPAEQA